jgi:hypothetical protein
VSPKIPGFTPSSSLFTNAALEHADYISVGIFLSKEICTTAINAARSLLLI